MGMQRSRPQGSPPQWPGGPRPQCSTPGQMAPPQPLRATIKLLAGQLSATQLYYNYDIIYSLAFYIFNCVLYLNIIKFNFIICS